MAPRLLLLRESFNGHWVGPAGSRHVLVDGLYNGWLGPSVGNAAPRYGPANAIRMAAAASALALLALLALVASGTRGGRRRRPARVRSSREAAGAGG
jgi:hypothetical protein